MERRSEEIAGLHREGQFVPLLPPPPATLPTLTPKQQHWLNKMGFCVCVFASNLGGQAREGKTNTNQFTFDREKDYYFGNSK